MRSSLQSLSTCAPYSMAAKKRNTKKILKKQQAIKKLRRVLNLTRTKKTVKKCKGKTLKKKVNQKGKGVFSVLIPLIATAIGSAISAR